MHLSFSLLFLVFYYVVIGPCTSGVVGQGRPKYCLMGDAVNTASRMCSNGGCMRAHLSADTVELLMQSAAGAYQVQSRGHMYIKVD